MCFYKERSSPHRFAAPGKPGGFYCGSKKNMSNDVLALAIISGMTVFFIIMLTAAAFYNSRQEKGNVLTGQSGGDDWLFKGFSETMYDAVIKRPPHGVMFGLDVAKYEKNCRVIHKKTDTKKTVALRLAGMVLLLPGIALSALLASASVVASACGLAVTAGIFFILYIYPSYKVEAEAKSRLLVIQDDLPRFVILLEKALDLPIDQAIILTAKKFSSPLSEDLLLSSNEAALGMQGGWQKMLVSLAKLYGIQDFSSLILDITNAYENGNDIREAVTRKAKELEESQVYRIEERDTKTKTMVFIPVIIFTLIPMVILLVYPMVQTLM